MCKSKCIWPEDDDLSASVYCIQVAGGVADYIKILVIYLPNINNIIKNVVAEREHVLFKYFYMFFPFLKAYIMLKSQYRYTIKYKFAYHILYT